MKILMLIDALEIGGAETHVLTLSQSLARAGNEVSVLSAGGQLEQTTKDGAVGFLHFPKNPRTTAGFLRCLLFLRRLLGREHFDVLHAHTRRTALMLRFLPRRQAAKALPRDLDPAILKTYRRSAVLRRLTPLRVVTAHATFAPRCRRLSFWGDVTLAVSEDIRRHLQDRLGCRRPVRIIPNGIVTDGTGSRADASVFSVAFASRLDADCSRAAFALLRIAPELHRVAAEMGRPLRLTLLGGGECYGALRRAAEEGIAAGSLPRECVTLTGATPRPQAYFERAQVFVGVSRAALEAVGCGCAVVLAGDEGYGGCLTPENFDTQVQSNFCCRGQGEITDERLLSDLLSLLRRSSTELRARSDRLRTRVRQEYDVSLSAQRTQAVYVRALSRKRRLSLICVGYFGRHNLGDESILRCLLRQLSGAAAPSSLSLPLKEGRPPTLARLHQRHTRGGSTDYHARRELRLSCGEDFPAFGERYRGRLPCGQEARSKHKSTTRVPLRLRLRVLCHRPKRHSWGYRYGGAAAIPRGRPLVVFWSLWKSDALLLGGGSLLQNASRHGRLSLLYYLSLPFLGWLLGCPFSLHANGVGPIRGRLGRWAVGLVLRRAAGISLRDAHSAVLLTRCGVPGSLLSSCPDPVARWAARQAKKRELPSRRGYVCICPRETDDNTLRRLLTLADEKWAGLGRVYVAMDGWEDTAPCRRLAQMARGRIVTPQNERVALALLHGADAVISMRLHALILAGEGSPKIAVPTRATEDKMRGANWRSMRGNDKGEFLEKIPP